METLDGSSARDEFAASFNTFSRNILCEVIGRVEGVRDLVNADPGVGSGLTMTLESANLVCARLAPPSRVLDHSMSTKTAPAFPPAFAYRLSVRSVVLCNDFELRG
jgi:hypothetical protein